jgi:3-oxoacyl-[acyl-carrier-protein] synthase-3
MLFNNISIHTVAHLEAPNLVTSAEISDRLTKTLKRVGLPLNYLERTTGIKERRFWDAGTQPSDAATLVAELIIQKSGLLKSNIGAVINTSISKDFIEPSVACIIHGNLKLSPECINFDVGNACLGFMNGIHIASTMVESGQVSHVLVVAAEDANEGVSATIGRLEKDYSTPDEVRNQLASLTLGSGAVAMIISRSDLAPSGHPIRGLVALSATEHNRLCCAWPDRMETDAPKLVMSAVNLVQKTYEKAKQDMNWKTTQFDEFACHQVSKSYIQKTLTNLNIEAHKVMVTYPDFGNMGSVSLPFTVSKLESLGRLIKGKKLAMLGAGSGLNCIAIEVQW